MSYDPNESYPSAGPYTQGVSYAPTQPQHPGVSYAQGVSYSQGASYPQDVTYAQGVLYPPAGPNPPAVPYPPTQSFPSTQSYPLGVSSTPVMSDISVMPWRSDPTNTALAYGASLGAYQTSYPHHLALFNLPEHRTPSEYPDEIAETDFYEPPTRGADEQEYDMCEGVENVGRSKKDRRRK